MVVPITVPRRFRMRTVTVHHVDRLQSVKLKRGDFALAFTYSFRPLSCRLSFPALQCRSSLFFFVLISYLSLAHSWLRSLWPLLRLSVLFFIHIFAYTLGRSDEATVARIHACIPLSSWHGNAIFVLPTDLRSFLLAVLCFSL